MFFVINNWIFFLCKKIRLFFAEPVVDSLVKATPLAISPQQGNSLCLIHPPHKFHHNH